MLLSRQSHSGRFHSSPYWCCTWSQSRVEHVERSSPSTWTQVRNVGQDRDVPLMHLPLSATRRKQLQEYFTAPLPAAMCVAACVRQLMRLKASLFWPVVNTQTLNGSSHVTEDCFDLTVGWEIFLKLMMIWSWQWHENHLWTKMVSGCQDWMCCNVFSMYSYNFKTSLRGSDSKKMFLLNIMDSKLHWIVYLLAGKFLRES